MTIDEIKTSNRQHGYHFFEPAALRFFASRIGQETYEGPGGVYFTTSEQFQPSEGPAHKRRYSVRKFDPLTSKIHTPGGITGKGFMQYGTSGAARTAAERMAKGEK